MLLQDTTSARSVPLIAALIFRTRRSDAHALPDSALANSVYLSSANPPMFAVVLIVKLTSHVCAVTIAVRCLVCGLVISSAPTVSRIPSKNMERLLRGKSQYSPHLMPHTSRVWT